MDICFESGYTTAFTLRGNEICRGSSYTPAYTIRGNEICFGSGYSAAYTIRGNEICEGSGYSAAFTIRGKEICYGSGYSAAYTMRESLYGGGGSTYISQNTDSAYYRGDNSKGRSGGFFRKTIFLLMSLMIQFQILKLWRAEIIYDLATTSWHSFGIFNVLLLGNAVICGLLGLLGRCRLAASVSRWVNLAVVIGVFALMLQALNITVITQIPPDLAIEFGGYFVIESVVLWIAKNINRRLVD